MNKILRVLTVFFVIYALWLFADSVLDNFSWFAKFWWFLYHILLKTTEFLTIKLVAILWNIDAFVIDYRKIALSTGQILTIWNEYLGFDVWALFFSFIIAWPSKWKIRLLAIPIGSIILFFTNVLLISYVIKEASYLSPQLTMPSPNKFKFILYIVMAIMWIVYIKFFSDKNFIKHIEKFL